MSLPKSPKPSFEKPSKPSFNKAFVKYSQININKAKALILENKKLLEEERIKLKNAY